MKIRTLAAMALLFLFGLCSNGWTQVSGERALYLSSNQTLLGCLYRPKGPGPFPAIIFNQHNATTPEQSAALKPFPQLAQLFLSKGYILFVPGRYPTLDSSGRKKTPGGDSELLKQNEDQARNLIAAVTWLKAQADVDDKRVSVIGEVAGGLAALFAVEKGLDVRAMVLFSPGLKALASSDELQTKLKDYTQSAKPPILLIQSQNDANLIPKNLLGPILGRKGQPNEAKVFPPFGDTAADAHRFAVDGSAVWQRDVFDFLQTAMN